jgi:hypothetical protein
MKISKFKIVSTDLRDAGPLDRERKYDITSWQNIFFLPKNLN